MIGLAVLALGGAAAAEIQTTGALYADESSATLSGFEVQSLCSWAGYEPVQDLLAALGPSLHWGFEESSAPWSDDAGSPVSVAPDGTLVCDQGVLALEPGQSVWTTPTISDPATVILVLGAPTVAGTAFTVAELTGGAGFDVRVTAAGATLHAWDAGGTAAAIVTASFDSAASAHVLAVSFSGTDANLWVDGNVADGVLPAPVGAPVLGLGAVPGTEPDGPASATAAFSATELALVPTSVAATELAAVFASATAP